MHTHHQDDTQINAEAAEWMVRLTGERDSDEAYSQDDELQAAFFRWLALSPMHLRTFLETAETFRKLGGIDPRHRLRLPDRDTSELANVIALPSQRKLDLTDPPSAERGAPLPELSLPARFSEYLKQAPWAAFVALACLLVLPLGFQHLDASTLIYATDIGQRRDIVLEDGSQVRLNTHSQIRVKLTRQTREVRLVQGEALFSVIHEKRPFTVLTADARIEDRGTQFSVYRPDAGDTQIAVIQGKVEVFSPDAASDPSARTDGIRQSSRSGAPSGRGLPAMLSAGTRAFVHHDATTTQFRVQTVSAHELQRQLGWRDGVLVFEGETLRQAIAEINRYNRRQLVIDDPTIANLRLGGTFSATDPLTFATTLGHAMRLRAFSDTPYSSIHLSGVRN